MAGWFKPLDAEPRRRQVLGFDIEGVGGPEGFLCGSIVGEYVYQFYTDREEMWNDLLHFGQEGFLLFAHNLQYDLPIVEGPAFPSGKLLFTRSSLLWADYEHWGRRVRFLDSSNLFPRFSVRGLGSLVNVPKLELDSRLLHELRSGNPWRFYTETQREQIRRYNQRDAEIVYLAVEMLQELILHMGGQLQSTIAGISMDIYRRRFHKYPWLVIGPVTNETARPAYYGGRVENFAFGRVPDTNMYDITSLYPYVQGVIKFPHPNRTMIDLEPSLTGSWWKWEGVVQATVEVPNVYIPPLPHRYNKRLFFPVGTLSGTWTIFELRQAIERGARLHAVDWVMGSSVTFNPFHEFVEELFKARLGYLVSNPGHANIVKLLLNSLYGRWGLNPAGGLYKLVDVEQYDDLSELKGFTTTDIGGRLFAYGMIESARQPDYVNVFFAAQIAAGGRAILLDELQRQGEAAIYCDTDSIITRGEIPTGDGLGQWREEMRGGVADMIGPKEYAVHNEVFGSEYRVKGVPVKLAEDYFKRGYVRFQRALSVREAIAQGRNPAEWVETFKTHHDVLPKRVPALPEHSPGDDWVISFPYSISELSTATSGRYPPPDFSEVFQVPSDLVQPLPEQRRLELLDKERLEKGGNS